VVRRFSCGSGLAFLGLGSALMECDVLCKAWLAELPALGLPRNNVPNVRNCMHDKSRNVSIQVTLIVNYVYTTLFDTHTPDRMLCVVKMAIAQYKGILNCQACGPAFNLIILLANISEFLTLAFENRAAFLEEQKRGLSCSKADSNIVWGEGQTHRLGAFVKDGLEDWWSVFETLVILQLIGSSMLLNRLKAIVACWSWETLCDDSLNQDKLYENGEHRYERQWKVPPGHAIWVIFKSWKNCSLTLQDEFQDTQIGLRIHGYCWASTCVSRRARSFPQQNFSRRIREILGLKW